MSRAFAVVMMLVILSPLSQAADDAKKVLEKMQGDWTVVSSNEDGKPTPPEEFKKYTITIKGEKFILNNGMGDLPMVIALDPTKTPAHIDLTSPDPKEFPSMTGIYDFRDNTLKIAISEKSMARPKKLNPANGVMLLELKRK